MSAATGKGLEVRVGLFVFLGLAVLGALVVQFGRVGEGLKSYYAVTVRFPDASGLLNGSDVLLSGAKIGRVSAGPQLVREGQGVNVPLRIYDFVKIPVGSKFLVGSSGLLGDRFVTVIPPPGVPNNFLHKDAAVEGTRESGLDDITREGGLLIGDLRGTVQNINATVTRLNEQALSPVNMENLKGSMEHLHEATGALSETSKKLDGVVNKADGTMSSAKKAADDVQVTLADARKTFQSATQVMQKATTGSGLLPTLLNNKEVANDLQALITNLRQHGVLFYKDSAAKNAPPPPAPPRR